MGFDLRVSDTVFLRADPGERAYFCCDGDRLSLAVIHQFCECFQIGLQLTVLF
jgi:hypothetical protein